MNLGKFKSIITIILQACLYLKSDVLLQKLPRRLPDHLVQPKVTFVPGRKRALTGREAADLQEKEEARRRRRAQIEDEKQARNNARQEEYTAEALQRQN
jgi:hypothetical protein